MLDSWGIIQYNQSCCSGQVTPDAKREGLGPVVQLVRTLACRARGRGFEPHPGRQKGKPVIPIGMAGLPFVYDPGFSARALFALRLLEIQVALQNQGRSHGVYRVLAFFSTCARLR